MTPATNSQMSRSSSTIKISSAMVVPVLSIPDPAGDRFSLARAGLSPLPCQMSQPVGVEDQRHACPLPRRVVREFQFAEMLLDDLLHDRKAETRAALARRHIGFGDRVPGVRKTDP